MLSSLKTPQSKGTAEYSKKFKEMFGVSFNAENIAIYEKKAEQYKSGLAANGVEKIFNEN